MESDIANRHRAYWLDQAKAVQRRVNVAWWLETLAAPLVILSVVGAAALLWLRREFPDTGLSLLLASVSGSVMVLALACLAKAARKFERTEDSLVRIEAAMRMRNALSTARAGVAPWPNPAGKIDDGMAWQWKRLCIPLLGALLLLTAGMWLPISANQGLVSRAPEEPQAWQQLSTELDYLTKEEAVDEPYLEEMRKRLEELKSQEEEQWFSHSSLEATDSLKKNHRAETDRVERELSKAGKALGALEKSAGSLGEKEQNRLLEEFDQALQGLQMGAMKPNPQLLEQMRQLDLKNPGNLTPEQLEQLKENLQKNAEALKGEAGEGEGEGEGKGEGAGDGDGDGDGDKEDEGNGSDKGGVDRGPGHSPGVLGAEKESVETGEMTALEPKDLSRAAPGDLMELQDGKHDVDRSGPTNAAGGNTNATGKGGDRVWRESLAPDEQRVLKRFFE